MRKVRLAFMHFWTLRMRRGVETMVISLSNELARRGADVSILTAAQTQTPLVAPIESVHIKAFPTFRYFEFITIAPFYALDLARSRYDVLITFFADFGEGLALQLASPFVRPPLVLNLTFPMESAPHRYNAYTKWGWNKKAARILADARCTARQGEKFFQRPVRTLPSGTDPHRFQPDLEQRAESRQRLGFHENDIVLLNVAALEERKGIWRVIDALPDIIASCPSVHYLILGNGPERERLERKVAELDLQKKVKFAGTTAELPPYYNASDIFVMLSDSEAGSVACLEAMSCGLPVVVSNTGGFDEVVDEKCGRLVDIYSQRAIVEAILELAGDGELRSRTGSAGRTKIIENFSWEKIAGKLLEMCKEISQ